MAACFPGDENESSVKVGLKSDFKENENETGFNGKLVFLSIVVNISICDCLPLIEPGYIVYVES